MMTVAFLMLTLAAFSLRASASIPADKSKAVIFVYQHVGDDSAPPQSNISTEQFAEHINELKKDGYAVLPLAEIISALKNGELLPPKTVGITFEGAYQSTLTNALPLLEDAKLPFTLFFSTDMIDGNSPTRLSWAQIKKLHKNNRASLGILPATYEHMATQTPEQNATLINRAIARYREMLDEDPAFFSYPYGEYNISLKKQLSTYSFLGVFGLHSGVVHGQSDFLSLPRFTMTGEYGDLDRFMLTATALPLPVTDVVPEDMVLTQNPPIIGFTIAPEIHSLSGLSCFASSQGKMPLTRIGGNRIEIRPPQPFTDRRTRINCTLPDDTVTPGEPQKWRWFSMLMTLPELEEDSGEDSSGTPESAGNPAENQ